MKLNLGCGTNRKGEGWINIDYNSQIADLEHDLTKPLPYPDNSIEKIFSSHVIEHFSRNEWELVRNDWLRVLKPLGTIEIHCPDFEICLQNYLTGDKAHWIRTIYGDQSDIGQFHKNGFTFEMLEEQFRPYKVEKLTPASDYDLHILITK